jgi:predicted CXXCH cytochrome family protein
VNNVHFLSPRRISITARALLLGLVMFAVILPVSAGAIRLSDTDTPTESPTPTPTITPTTVDTPTVVPQTEYDWLAFPPQASDLASVRSLALLAGQFINHGLVDASSCSDGGLMKSGGASPCGEDMARNAVIIWQNQFDDEILRVAKANDIPPFVLKNIFIKESQFWPETYQNPVYGGEYGLGHLTEMGADTLLRWNTSFYKELCSQNFNETVCKKPYVFQDHAIQAGLKGVLLTSINADCFTCAGGVDLNKARNSISVVAAMLVADRNHVRWLVNGFSSAGKLSVENTMRFTLISYNVGPGCFTSAFYGTRGKGNPLSWKDVSKSLVGPCEAVVDYVSFMENVYTADPSKLALASYDTSPAARMVLGPLPTIEPTITSTSTPEPVTATPTDTVQLSGTPTEDTLTATTDASTPTSTLPVTDQFTPTEIIATETPTASALTDVNGTALEPATEAPTETASPTPTETIIPTVTPTPFILPTAFVPAADVQTGEIVVKFNGLVPDFLANAAIGSAGGAVQSQVDALGLTIVTAPQDQIPQVLNALDNNLLVDYAEPNYPVQAFYTPTDPSYVNQSYLADMQIPQAWDVTRGAGVVVAVIDTGVDITHPDLASSLWVNAGETGLDSAGRDKSSNGMDDDGDGYIDNSLGWNFVDGNNNFADVNGHGTHISGIIAAGMDNNQGIAGIAPQARIMPLKALDDSGHGTYIQVAEAIIYAVDHGAQVINLGFGGTANSEALLAATNYAYDHNVIVVAAGGNTATMATIYPAANPNVIAVSALNPDLSLASFSTVGDMTRISAPGVGIYSTMPNGGYAYMSGTSMAAAQVSGVTALMVSLPQFDTPDKVRSALFSTAYDLGDPGADLFYGYGLVHAFDALTGMPGNFVTPTASPTPVESVTPAATPEDSGVNIMTDAANAAITNYTRSCSTNAASYTAALAGTGVPVIQANNAYTGPISLGPGFNFWYMGTRYTQIWVSSNGWLSFNNPTGTAAAGSIAANDLDNSNNTINNTNARPILAPLWDNLGGAAAGSVASYQTSGIAPNRSFTFEWWNYQWNTGNASRVSMRVVLHESTGVIDFLYFPNNANGGNSASIGITGTANNSFLSASVVTNCPPTWSSIAETANLNTKLPQGRTYTFTPPQNPNAPAMQAPSNVTNTAMRLNWTDASSNEDGFVIYTSTDGVNYTFVAQTAANATFYNASGLANSANNYWRIYSVTEGALSSAIAQLNAPSALTFSNIKTTSMTLNWTDNATNESGDLIYNSTDNINFNYVATTAANATTYNASGLSASTTYYWRVQAINSGALSAAVSGTRATNTLPVVAISAPANNSTYAKNTSITFTGTATDVQDGIISSGLIWYSNISGPIGTGASVTFSGLLPGTHTITAQSTDSNGETGTASITITITPLSGPHGGFNGSTDQCAACHRAHSAEGDTYLTTDPNSVVTSDAFCLSCHNGITATAVSTHSNVNWASAAEPAFEVRCIQCHNSHGTSNLFAIRTDIKSSLIPQTSIDPLTFTSLTGPNSFDDNASANRLCVSCHTSASITTAPHHPGGVNHLDGKSYAGQSCVACHPHNADTTTTTLDGFMPVRSTNP